MARDGDDRPGLAMEATTTALRGIGRALDMAGELRGCYFTFHRGAHPALWQRLPNRNFYLDLEFLDSLLGYLKANRWDVVKIADVARAGARGGPARRRFVNFSIDDCYRDTYEEVVPVFRRHGVPITLFVSTGIPDGTMPLWGAGLEDYILNHDAITIDGRNWSIDTAERKRSAYLEIEALWDGPEAAAHYHRFCQAAGIDERAMHWKHAISWDMLEELAGDPIIEIGSHTVNHPRVSSLTPEAAFSELFDSKTRLEERLGSGVPFFAFPYGRAADCSERDFSIARKAGYAGVATTRKGIVRHRAQPYALPRNTLNGAHKTFLHAEMHLTGLTGLAARLSGRV